MMNFIYEDMGGDNGNGNNNTTDDVSEYNYNNGNTITTVIKLVN